MSSSLTRQSITGEPIALSKTNLMSLDSFFLSCLSKVIIADRSLSSKEIESKIEEKTVLIF